MIDKGFNLVTVGSDSRYIAAGAKSDLEKLKGIKGSKSKGTSNKCITFICSGRRALNSSHM